MISVISVIIMNTPSNTDNNMEIDTSPIDSEKHRAVSKSNSNSSKRNQGSLLASTRRVATPRRVNLERVSSPSLCD